MDETAEASDPTPAGDGGNELTLACDRCRRKKIKCSRGHPCSQCTAGETSCTYDLGHKPRIRRQRVRVSNDLEHTVEHIAKTVDDLKLMIQGLALASPVPTSPQPTIAAVPNPVHHVAMSATPPSRPSPASVNTPGISSTRSPVAPQTEYSGESSIFAHALFATAFLQNAVGNSSSLQVNVEMAPVIQTLSSITEAQKQTADSPDVVFPHARPLDDGRKPQNFPTPAADKVFGCLRMAQEHDQVEALWFPDFESLGHFTEYVIKVCSPGESSEAELIIFNAGMHWLFLECASFLEDESAIADYEAQAGLCRDNLETLLAHLGFHILNTLEYAHALNMAATYCLQTIKTSTAWGFIATASYICQSLGLQSAASLYPESVRQKRRKLRLFWTVYQGEKGLALRLGRPSYFRDSDVTVPRPEQPSGPDTLLNKVFPLWVQIGHLQGRVYEEIYSPGAFLQPEEVRYARARALIADVNNLMEASEALKKETEGASGGEGQSLVSRLSWRSDRITSLSMLTLIYRSLPPTEPFDSSFAADCINTARQALEEHEQCLAILDQATKKSVYTDLFIDWSLLQSPFVPFTIIFCHAIESSSKADLGVLKRFLDSLERTPYSSRHVSTQNQLRLFQALYRVAVQYTSVKESSSLQEGAWPRVAGPSTGGVSAGDTPLGQSMEYTPTSTSAGAGLGEAQAVSHPAEDQFLTSFGLQADSSGGPLASWFASNQQLMRMLENT